MSSAGKYVLYFAILGIFSGIPMALLYIPPFSTLFTTELMIFDGMFFASHITIMLNTKFLLQLTSTAIGLIGGFIIYCFLEHGQCQEDDFPQLEILLNE